MKILGKDEFQESLTLSAVWVTYHVARRDRGRKWEGSGKEVGLADRLPPKVV